MSFDSNTRLSPDQLLMLDLTCLQTLLYAKCIFKKNENEQTLYTVVYLCIFIFHVKALKAKTNIVYYCLNVKHKNIGFKIQENLI